MSLPVTQMTGARPTTLSRFNGLIEIIGWVLIVLGLFTRPVAFILAGDMAVAYFLAHSPRGFYPLLNGGELAIIYSISCQAERGRARRRAGGRWRRSA